MVAELALGSESKRRLLTDSIRHPPRPRGGTVGRRLYWPKQCLLRLRPTAVAAALPGAKRGGVNGNAGRAFTNPLPRPASPTASRLCCNPAGECASASRCRSRRRFGPPHCSQQTRWWRARHNTIPPPRCARLGEELGNCFATEPRTLTSLPCINVPQSIQWTPV